MKKVAVIENADTLSAISRHLREGEEGAVEHGEEEGGRAEGEQRHRETQRAPACNGRQAHRERGLPLRSSHFHNNTSHDLRDVACPCLAPSPR